MGIGCGPSLWENCLNDRKKTGTVIASLFFPARRGQDSKLLLLSPSGGGAGGGQEPTPPAWPIIAKKRFYRNSFRNFIFRDHHGDSLHFSLTSGQIRVLSTKLISIVCSVSLHRFCWSLQDVREKLVAARERSISHPICPFASAGAYQHPVCRPLRR